MVDSSSSWNYSAVYAVFAGIAAASGSVFGKLCSSAEPWWLWSLCILLMVVSNALVWTLFVRALVSSRSSLPATITSASVNYCCSAVFGWLLFGERTSLLWWAGATLVLMGLLLINSSKEKTD